MVRGTFKLAGAGEIGAGAVKLFGRGEGRVAWTEVPLKDTGKWLLALYGKTGGRDKTQDFFAQKLASALDTWSESPADASKAKKAFECVKDLIKKMPAATGAAVNSEMQKFRSAAFSASMALSAGYESDGEAAEFPETFAKVKLAERMDRANDKFGGPPPKYQIDVNEDPLSYWSAMRPDGAFTRGIVAEILQMNEDLKKLQSSTDAKERANAFDRLTKNFEEVIGPKCGAEARGVMAMVTVEALREPLHAFRDGQPNRGRGLVPRPQPDLELLRELATENEQRYKNRDKEKDPKEDPAHV